MRKNLMGILVVYFATVLLTGCGVEQKIEPKSEKETKSYLKAIREDYSRCKWCRD